METPDVTCVRMSPTVPSVTRTGVGFPFFTSVTRWMVPTVRTAEEGTVVTSTERWVTIPTSASTPDRPPRSAESREMVTGYDVVVDPLVATTPMDATLPCTTVLVESGVTWAGCPTATRAMSVTGMLVVSS